MTYKEYRTALKTINDQPLKFESLYDYLHFTIFHLLPLACVAFVLLAFGFRIYSVLQGVIQ